MYIFYNVDFVHQHVHVHNATTSHYAHVHVDVYLGLHVYCRFNVSIPHVTTQLRKECNISDSTSPNLLKFGRILDGHEIHIPAKSYQYVKSKMAAISGHLGFYTTHSISETAPPKL